MRIAFTSAGAPRHGKNLCAQAQGVSDSEGWSWECSFLEWERNGYDYVDFADYDWLWNVGNFENVFVWMSSLPDSCHRIAQWIGTDILQHQELAQRGYPDPFGSATIHIADAPNLRDEASKLTSLNVGYVRSIPPVCYARTPIPQWSDVLGYVPTGRDEFFRYQWFVELARDYPALTFHLLGRADTPNETGLDNVVHEKEVSGDDKRRLFEQCFCYLRPCEHDGIGLTFIEMAQLGRTVFHSDVRIPYAIPARSVGEIEYWLDSCLDQHTGPDPVVSDYYRAEYGLPALTKDLQALKERMENMK